MCPYYALGNEGEQGQVYATMDEAVSAPSTQRQISTRRRKNTNKARGAFLVSQLGKGKVVSGGGGSKNTTQTGVSSAPSPIAETPTQTPPPTQPTQQLTQRGAPTGYNSQGNPYWDTARGRIGYDYATRTVSFNQRETVPVNQNQARMDYYKNQQAQQQNTVSSSNIGAPLMDYYKNQQAQQQNTVSSSNIGAPLNREKKLTAFEFAFNVEAGDYIAQQQGQAPGGIFRGEYYVFPEKLQGEVQPSSKVFGEPSFSSKLMKNFDISTLNIARSKGTAKDIAIVGGGTAIIGGAGVIKGAYGTVTNKNFLLGTAGFIATAGVTAAVPAIGIVTIPAMYGVGGYNLAKYGTTMPERFSKSQNKIFTGGEVIGEIGTGVVASKIITRAGFSETITQPIDETTYNNYKSYKTTKTYPDYGVPETEFQKSIGYEPKITQKISNRYLAGKKDSVILSLKQSGDITQIFTREIWPGYTWKYGKQPIVIEYTKEVGMVSPKKPISDVSKIKSSDNQVYVAKTYSSSGYAQELVLEPPKTRIEPPKVEQIKIKKTKFEVGQKAKVRTIEDVNLGNIQSPKIEYATGTVTGFIVGQKSKQKQGYAQDTAFKQITIQKQEQKQVVIPGQDIVQKQVVYQIPKQGVMQKQLPIQIVQSGLMFGAFGLTKFSYPQTFYNQPIPGGGMYRNEYSGFTFGRNKRGYQPSLTGAIFQLKTPKLKRSRFLTGFEIRGI